MYKFRYALGWGIFLACLVAFYEFFDQYPEASGYGILIDSLIVALIASAAIWIFVNSFRAFLQKQMRRR
jgi:hypothetical protein